MLTINVSDSEELLFRDFKEGNAVQFRIAVSPGEEKGYAKGKVVLVKLGNEEENGKIVSDPLIVSPSEGKGQETISLVVEKT